MAKQEMPKAKGKDVEKQDEELDELEAGEDEPGEDELDEDDEDELGEDEEDVDEDEEDEDDEDEDEEDEDEDEAHAPPKAADNREDGAEDQEPGWWIPHAVLGALIVIGVLGFFGFFNSIVGRFVKTDHVEHSTAGSAHPAASAPASAAAAVTARARPTVTARQPVTAVVDRNLFGAKRITVAFKGSRSSKSERSKEDAKKRADEALKKLRGGAKFDEVATEFTDEPGSKSVGGNMGNFRRGVYPDLEPTLDKMKVGDLTDVFESPFGYEILQRTK